MGIPFLIDEMSFFFVHAIHLQQSLFPFSRWESTLIHMSRSLTLILYFPFTKMLFEPTRAFNSQSFVWLTKGEESVCVYDEEVNKASHRHHHLANFWLTCKEVDLKRVLWDAISYHFLWILLEVEINVKCVCCITHKKILPRNNRFRFAFTARIQCTHDNIRHWHDFTRWHRYWY